MAKFLIEAIATVKLTYAIEAEDMDAAVDEYFQNQETLEPVNHFFVGELLSDVSEACCDEHFQELIDSSKEQSESTVIELGARVLN